MNVLKILDNWALFSFFFLESLENREFPDFFPPRFFLIS